MKNKYLTLVTGLAVALTSCNKENTTIHQENPVIIQSSGDITNDVAGFRTMLGTLNTTPGAVTGHREINWDGVADSLKDTVLPLDLFNPTAADASPLMQRGLTYDPNKGSFMVSSNGFSAVNPDAADEFPAFSGNSTFANISTAQWPVKFQKAGTTAEASVQAFGAVFSDVDEASTTSLEFFDGETSLGKYFVPPHDNTSSFSFLAVRFGDHQHITKVLVTHDGFLSEGIKDVSEGGTRDLVVLDDFIYSEPVALP